MVSLSKKFLRKLNKETASEAYLKNVLTLRFPPPTSLSLSRQVQPQLQPPLLTAKERLLP